MSDDVIEIPLSDGYVAIVDRVDAHIAALKWRTTSLQRGQIYAQRSVRVAGKRTTVLLHRAIMSEVPAGLYIDHIDGNGLNNRRSNLRAVEPTINQRNRADAAKGNKSGVLGVSWNSRRRPWRAQIRAEGRKIDLGCFDTIEEARAARLAAEAKYWGIEPRRASAHNSQRPAPGDQSPRAVPQQSEGE